MSDRETIDVYDAKADDYAAMSDSFNRTDPILAEFIADCPPGGRVLDLGCGPGASAATMAEAGLTVDAIDASAEMVRRAGARPGVNAYKASFDDITGEGIYDGIWANFSLLHANREDMPRILAQLARAMTAEGRLHIGVKLGEGTARDTLGRRYTYFTDEELTGLLADTGLTVSKRAFGTTKGLDGSMADWICLTAHA